MEFNPVKILIGGTGVATTEVVNHITPEIINEGVGLIGQLVIIIATIISLFKKKKHEPKL